MSFKEKIMSKKGFYAVLLTILIVLFVILFIFRDTRLVKIALDFSDDIGNVIGFASFFFAFFAWAAATRMEQDRKATRKMEPLPDRNDAALIISFNDNASNSTDHRMMINNVKEYLQKPDTKESQLTEDAMNQLLNGKFLYNFDINNEEYEVITDDKGRIVHLFFKKPLPENDAEKYSEEFMNAVQKVLSECIPEAGAVYLFYKGPAVLAFKVAEAVSNQRRLYLHHYFTVKGNDSKHSAHYRYCGCI